jgi:hypothetical protein
MIRRAALAAFLVASTIPGAAMAVSPYGQQMMHTWGSTDRCAAAAQKAFPDYTPESNAKRDANMKQCLSGANLPPRSDLDHPAPPKP